MKPAKLAFGLLALGAVVLAMPFGAAGNNPPAGGKGTTTICHKPGTPAEKTLTVPNSAVAGHLGHGDNVGGCAKHDKIIDADGVATRFDGLPGAQEVTVGDPLKSFPVTGSPPFSGLDAFDNDGNGSWTFGASGDDLHSEDPGSCPGASRNAVHDLGEDCKVLDIDDSLTDGQQVTCDVEFQIEFTAGACDSLVRYHDTNNDNTWDSGEDIVYDGNNNSIFD